MRFLIFLSLLVSFIQAQAEVCSPMKSKEVREAFAQWYNDNRYDDEEVAMEDADSILQSFEEVELLYSKAAKRGGVEIYRIVYGMGEETQSAMISVRYYSEAGKLKCSAHKSNVADF